MMKKSFTAITLGSIALTIIAGCGSLPSTTKKAAETPTTASAMASMTAAPTETPKDSPTPAVEPSATSMTSVKPTPRATPAVITKATAAPTSTPKATQDSKSKNMSSSPKATPAPVATPAPTAKPTPTPASSTPENVKVTIKTFKFSPAQVTVKKGTTIVFANDDNVTHTATGAGFDTGDITAGSSKSVTFDKIGTYVYECTPHPFMTATIIVTD